MCLAKEFWMGKPCRKGPRDRVAVEGAAVKYLLWGNEIASWNREEGVLVVDDCGWKTQLTVSRLNSIIGKFDFFIRRKRGALYIRDWREDKFYLWEGRHVIDVESRRITPCTLKRFNEGASKSLKKYYERVRRVVGRRKFLFTATLDGFALAFIGEEGARRLSRHVLGLRICSGGLKAYEGYATVSKIYSAFMRGNAQTIVNYLAEEGFEIDGLEDLMWWLDFFDVDLSALPERAVREIALANLLEGQ